MIKNRIINDDSSLIEDENVSFNSLAENCLTEQTLIVKKNSEIVRDLNAPFYFVKTFPWLFPYGSGSISGNHLRKIKISRNDWFAHIINLGYQQKYASKQHCLQNKHNKYNEEKDDDDDIIMRNTKHFDVKTNIGEEQNWMYPFQNDKLFGLIGYTWLSKQRCCQEATTGFHVYKTYNLI